MTKVRFGSAGRWPMSVQVNAHVSDEQVVTVVVHPQDGRAVLTLGESDGPEIVLFASRAGLVHLRDVLAATVDRLNAATAQD